MSVTSNILPSVGARRALGWTTWKSLETSRDGRPAMSGHVALMLQTSLNILRDPAAMARMIVGSEAGAYA